MRPVLPILSPRQVPAACAAALTALVLLAGCSERARLNPFDPRNPQTGGRPSGFVAIAGDQSVRLGWTAVPAAGLLGYELYRLAPGDSVYRLIRRLPADVTEQGDFGLANGLEHRYRLYFVFDRGLSAPAEDAATPGPLRPWVADYDGARIVRLSADGRHIAESVPAGGIGPPSAVDVDPATGWVWAASPAGGVLVYQPANRQVTILTRGLSYPVTVLADLVSHAGWVGDAGAGAGDGAVLHLGADGTPLAPGPLGPLRWPGSLAFDYTPNTLWVAERDADRVRRFRSDGLLLGVTAVSRPSRVAVDPVTHELWVTSYDAQRVVRLAPDGAALDTIGGFAGPIGIAVDHARGQVWVADNRVDQLVVLDLQGRLRFKVFSQPGAREIAVDPSTGGAWVVLEAAGAVSRISPAGQELERVGDISGATDLALDNLDERLPLPGGGPRATGTNGRPPPSR